jgi:hypothetical protein
LIEAVRPVKGPERIRAQAREAIGRHLQLFVVFEAV